MKKPAINYLEFRFSRLKEPRFAHVWLLLDWFAYIAMYILTERLIPVERCHVVRCALDDVIPFHEGFLVFYCYWYVLLAGSLLYFFLYDIRNFKRLQVYIIITQIVALIVYIVWPSIQPLRPDSFARDNILTRTLAAIYAIDTPTGVCPSLHAAYSLGIASVWCKKKEAGFLWKLLIVALVILVCLSTMFIKQHSAVDVFAALPLGLLAEIILYRDYWKEKWGLFHKRNR